MSQLDTVPPNHNQKECSLLVRFIHFLLARFSSSQENKRQNARKNVKVDFMSPIVSKKTGHGRDVVQEFKPLYDKQGQKVDGIAVAEAKYDPNMPQISDEVAEAIIEHAPDGWRDRFREEIESIQHQ